MTLYIHDKPAKRKRIIRLIALLAFIIYAAVVSVWWIQGNQAVSNFRESNLNANL